MRLPLGIKMDPNRVISSCLIVYLSFTSCLSATLNPQNTWNVNLNSQDPVKTSDEKATTSKTGLDQDTTTGFKFEKPGSSAEAPPKLNYGLKSDLSTDFPPKGLGFRIPGNAETKLKIESNSEKLGVTSIDVDVENIKKNEMKPTSSAPIIFDPFHLIQAEQNMMKKKLAQLPLVHMNKDDETSTSEGTPLSTQYSTINTVKVSDEKVSEAPLGFLSLYESTPKRKISKVENANKLSHAVHNLGLFGNSSKVFASSQSILSQRSKLHASDELKVDSTTAGSKSTVAVNFEPLEPNFATSQKYSKGQKDTTSEKLQARSGIVEESTHESLGISRNPTQFPLAESTTNGIQLKLIPLEKRNKDALTLVEKKDKVNVSDSLLPVLDSIQLKAQKMVGTVSQIEQSSDKEVFGQVSGKGLENTILPKNEDSGAKFRSVFQPKTNEPTVSTETINTQTTPFESGKKEAIDAGVTIPKGPIMAFMNSSSHNKISVEKIGDTQRKFSLKEGLETKTIERKTEDIIGKNREETSRSRVEDVTRSVPVISTASSLSSPSSDIKYRGNVKVADLKMNSNTKYISKGKLEAKGDVVFEADAKTIDPAVSVGSFINTQLKGIQNSKEKVDVEITTKKPAAKGELEIKGDEGLQISENKVEDVTRSNKGFSSGSLVSTHFPDIYYRSNGKVIDGKMNKELKNNVDIGSKKVQQTAGSKSEGVTILNASTEISEANFSFFLQSANISKLKLPDVTKIIQPVTESLMSTSFPNIQYKRKDKVDGKMNANSDFSSKGKLKDGDKRFRLERISESKMGNVILTTSESSSGSVKPKGVLVQQPKVFQQQGV